MTVSRVIVIVEDRSMGEALHLLLPMVLGGTEWEIHEHRGKTDLLKKLPARLRGYSWLPKDWRIVVLLDRDDDDCQELKRRLESIAQSAGVATRTNPSGTRFAVVNRLAIEELEAWFFGDWEAVRVAYPRVRKGIPRQAKYRAPDAIKGGTSEALERIMQAAGYFRSGLRKVEAARAIAAHMDPARNTSPSFRVFRDALAEMATPVSDGAS